MGSDKTFRWNAERKAALELHVGRFEAAWSASALPEIKDFLPDDSVLRRAAMIEMLHADVEFRQNAGLRLEFERYLLQFPELREEPALRAELPQVMQQWLNQRGAITSAKRPGSTSETLLGRLRNPDDQTAWSRFVNLYTPLLLHWTRRVGLSQPDSADLVQEVFALLVQTMPEFQYQPQRSFRAWLRTVLVNKWRELQRRKKLPIVPGRDGAAVDEIPESEASAAFWELEYQKFLVSRALDLMQEQFQPSTWKACWGVVVEGRSAAEMAQELNMSEGAVYVAKSRVLRHLRQELGNLWD